MKILIAMLAGCGVLAFASFAPAQSSSARSSQKKTQIKVQSKPSVNVQTNRRSTWRNDPWWTNERSRMNRDLRLTGNQGQRISTINRAASDRIHAAHNSGLRGTALSRRIRLIRADARVQIEKVLSSAQRRTWNWPEWERRWDQRWNRKS